MTEMTRSPRRIEHVRENSDKLFHDMFASCINGQKPMRDESGFPRVPWKDRNLPPSFFQPPPPNETIDSQLAQPTANNHFAGISHAYSRSTPAINFAPPRHMYPKPQPTANLWGPSTIPASSNGSIHQDYCSEGLKEIHSLPVVPTDPYNNGATNTYGQFEQRTQIYQPQQQVIQHGPMSYQQQHIHHGRQASLPYSNPRLISGSQRMVSSTLKHQQSKPTSDWWPQQQPSPQQYPPPNVSVSNPSVQQWPSNPQTHNQWQSPVQDVFATPLPNRSLPVTSQQNYPNDWSNGSNSVISGDSWTNGANASNSDGSVVDQQAATNQPSLAPPLQDDQKQQLLFIAAKLQEERNKMQAKMQELDKKLEDVMAALSVTTAPPAVPSNGYYSLAHAANSPNPDDLVPSLQIEQSNSIITPTSVENRTGAVGWM